MPGGVAIRLESPAADALRRAGFDGGLDTHFWDHFGGALLLDDSASARAGGANRNTARVPSDATAMAPQNSVTPLQCKAQGAEVSIFVDQDFGFSGVCGLKAL
jgi:type IV secretion system protein VirB10